MPIVFACAASHAPGMTAWTDTAPKEQSERFLGCYRKLGEMLATSRPDVLVAITVEHWANFFLNHMPAFCIGRADYYDGPVEEWLKIPKARVPGDSQLSAEILAACLNGGFDPTFSDELLFDHATMLPLHFLNPKMAVPVIPVIINTLTMPMPTPMRCFAFGQFLGRKLTGSEKRVAVVATGGLSHWPGEAKHAIGREKLLRQPSVRQSNNVAGQQLPMQPVEPARHQCTLEPDGKVAQPRRQQPGRLVVQLLLQPIPPQHFDGPRAGLRSRSAGELQPLDPNALGCGAGCRTHPISIGRANR